MPKVKFIKPWRHFNPDDTLKASVALAGVLYKAGVIKKPKAPPRKKPAATPAAKK